VAAGSIGTLNQTNPPPVTVKDRTACIAELQKFYRAVDPILNRNLPKGISDADFQSYAKEANAWIQTAADWIVANMGSTGLSKFQDQNGISITIWERAANPSHNGAINLLTKYKANLNDMMLSGAWDDTNTKCVH
jgi:hypothetical protein